MTPICAPRFRKVHLHGSIIYKPKPIDKGHKKRLLISSRKKNNRSNIPLAVSFKFEIRMFRLIRGRSRLIKLTNTGISMEMELLVWCRDLPFFLVLFREFNSDRRLPFVRRSIFEMQGCECKVNAKAKVLECKNAFWIHMVFKNWASNKLI